jgi:hypothetical protein
MPRQNKQWNIAIGALQLFLLAGAAYYFFPQLRGAMILAGLLAGATIIIFIIHPLAIRLPRQGRQAPESFPRLCETSETGRERSNASPSIGNATDFATKLRSIDWFQFEKLTAVVYRKLGYTVTRLGGANPDDGIDLIAEKSGERMAVQCKHWKSWRVGVRNVRELLGALSAAGISKGVLVTLHGYTNEAREFAAKHGIVFLDERKLVEMLKAVDAHYDPELLSIFQDHRKVCPKCEKEMVLRTATRGTNAGGQFWGCSGYPRCRFTFQAI